MKKLLHKKDKEDKKDKEEKKKEKEEKKKEKEEKKKEKKEKKEKSKKNKKHSASTSSLEQVPDTPNSTSQSTTVVTETTTPEGATKTVVVEETVKETSGERVSETKREEKVTGDLSGENVIKTTTTTTITETEPDKPVETKTVVKETTNETPQGVERIVVTKKSSEVQSAPSTREFLEETEPDKPVETKTVVKETTNQIPQGVQRIVVTKKSSEVQSIPSTREYLTENFAEVAKYIQPRGGQDSTGQPGTHVSERTVIRETNDGGKTVKTVTKVVSDDQGKRETTTTTTLGGNDEGEDVKKPEDEGEKDITSEDVERKADLPEWLNDIPKTSTTKKDKIDDSIEIPFTPPQAKSQEKPKPTGPKVVEEILPVKDSKENIMDLLDDLENAEKTKPKEEKPKPPEDIPFTYEPKKPEKKVYDGVPVTEKVGSVKLANKAETAQIDFDRLEKREEPKQPARTVQQTTRKVVSTNGDTVETVTKTVTDEDGKVKKTETKTISGQDQKPKQFHDVNSNIIESSKPKKSPKTSKRNLQDTTATNNAKNITEDDDDDDDDREVLEEIIVIEKKRKVRIPKSFVPYEKERPKAVLPLDMLIERPSRPRKLPPVGRRVDEKIEEQTQNRNSEIPDLDEMDRILTALEAERQ